MLGEYVEYKGEVFIVTEDRGDKIRILRPVDGIKVLQVLKSSVTRKYAKAHTIEYKEAKYLVTRTNIIISVKTGKVMKWSDNHGDRVAILKLKSVALED